MADGLPFTVKGSPGGKGNRRVSAFYLSLEIAVVRGVATDVARTVTAAQPAGVRRARHRHADDRAQHERLAAWTEEVARDGWTECHRHAAGPKAPERPR